VWVLPSCMSRFLTSRLTVQLVEYHPDSDRFVRRINLSDLQADLEDSGSAAVGEEALD
jgi:hypothetical protein